MGSVGRILQEESEETQEREEKVMWIPFIIGVCFGLVLAFSIVRWLFNSGFKHPPSP